MARILLVDDQEAVLETTQAMLEILGHCVMVADTGAYAIMLLESIGYDLLLTDLNMEPVNGMAVIASAKIITKDKIAIVIMTGDTEMAVGASYPILMKPFTMKQLRHAVERALSV